MPPFSLKYRWLLWVAGLSGASCEAPPDVSYYQVIRANISTMDTITVRITSLRLGSQLRLTYALPFDTIVYQVDTLDPTCAAFLSSPTLPFVRRHTYRVDYQGQRYRVYQFSTADGTIDGGSEHYWTQRFGFFLTRGTTWPNYWVLQSTNADQNAVIWSLVKGLYPPIREDLNYVRQDLPAH